MPITAIAGFAASVLAADGAPSLAVKSGKAGASLLLNGAPVYSTGAAIQRARIIPMHGSQALVAVWDEASGGVSTSHFALSLTGEKFDQILSTENMIRLRYATFDPLAGEPVVPAALRAGAGNELYLVQFVSTPLDEMRRDIEALGGVVEEFLTDDTHIVRLTPRILEQVRALPYVRWVGEHHPAYRMSEEVRAEAVAVGSDAAGVRYSIACFRRGMAQQQAVADAAKALGGIVEVFSPDQFRLEVTIPPSQIVKLARMNEVSGIDHWGGPGGTDMNVVRQLEGATPLLSGLGFTGQGVRGEVHDTEVRVTHQAFQSPPVILRGGSAGNPAVNGYHGSACYGINFADWPANPNYNGMVTDCEQGIFADLALSTQFGGSSTRLTLNTQATDPLGPYTSSYQSSSVGSTQGTTYTTVSQETDDYLFRVDYLSFQSQSNTGLQTSRPQAWAKNIVSVGGVAWAGTLSRTDDTWTTASFGPAADARVKPDLTNCYNLTPATWGQTSDTGTTTFGGTSGATPITAGAGGLLLQMWHQGVWAGFGGGSSVFTDRPKSTTAKAMLINTAFRYPLTQGGLTRAKQGWGMPALDALYNIRAKTFIINESDPLVNAQTRSYALTVAAGEPNLRATLVYLDPKGGVAAAQERINDLSLRLTSPGGTIYWGNNGLIAANFSTAGGAANTIDTVENVFIQNPEAGTWTVDVIGTQIVQDARLETVGVTDADFALVVTGVATAPPESCYANCDLSTATPILNANDFQCFLNAFAAGDSYANCDGTTTEPVLNANDFQCFLDAFAIGCT